MTGAFMPDTQIKICGITTADIYRHCADEAVDWVGFVFFEKSPRHLSYDAAAELVDTAPKNGPKRVALTVNADDDAIADILAVAKPDMIQLHGHESADRAAHIQQKFGVKVMPVIAIRTASDLIAATTFADRCEWLLFDAAMPSGAVLPGGRGEQFDWQILADFKIDVSWMLAGGLDADNVARAIKMVQPDAVDISSGVEHSKGVKSKALISRFVQAVRG